MPTDLELLEAYRDTTWAIELPTGALPVRIGERLPSGPFRLPAGIVTAYNPGSEPTSPESNRAAHERLRAELNATGAVHHPTLAHGTGESAARWNEPGFLVLDITAERIVDLGRRFGQNAVVWIGPDAVPHLLVSRLGFAGAATGDRL